MIHGFGASTFTWRYLVEDLSKQYRTVAVDLRGFGKSPKPQQGGYAVMDQVRSVRDVIRKLTLNDLTIVGHSYGGLVALVLAMDLADFETVRLHSLVILCGAVYPLTLPRFIQLFQTPVAGHVSLGNISRKAQVRAVLESCVYDQSMVTDELVDQYTRPLEDKGAGTALAKVAAQLALPDFALSEEKKHYQKYNRITEPVQLIWGRHDQVVPLVTAYRLNDDLKDSRLDIIEQCGHIPQEEQPRETLRIMKSFFKRLAGRNSK